MSLNPLRVGSERIRATRASGLVRDDGSAGEKGCSSFGGSILHAARPKAA